MNTATIPQPTNADRQINPSWVGRLGRRMLLRRLADFAQGELIVRDGGTTLRFGTVSETCPISVELEVLDGRFWGDAAFGGTVGAAEAYIRGYWRTSDLTGLVRLMVRNRAVMDRLEGGAALISTPLRKLLHFANRNTRRGSERNIAAHYDLGNDFFAVFLDPTMAYSCAIYPSPDSTLEQASRAKFDVVCRKLDLRPGEHLLEIGTGWGGLAIHAAHYYGVKVTTTTISKEQYEYARAAVERAGLAGQITLLQQDYRELRGVYDKVVSVEMVEAVGHQFLDGYFRVLSSLTREDGMVLLQAITIQDQMYEYALNSVDFIQRYVFPGGFVPSVTTLVSAARRATDMKLFHLEDIGPHYARTLRDWRQNLSANLQRARALGCTEEFLRLWEYYLCYCEGGYEERQLGNVHLLFAKPRCRRTPLVSGLGAR
jgi:cyclopropane-fatty-acyl-phospholipid synthase